MGRVAAAIGLDNPERIRLERFAREGVRVPVAESFVPSGLKQRPPLRRKYIESGGAVDKMIVEEFRQAELAFILPIEVVERGQERVNLSVLSWAAKNGKVKGRNLNDCSYGGAPESSLNCPEVKKEVEELWGKICHPTLEDLVRMV